MHHIQIYSLVTQQRNTCQHHGCLLSQRGVPNKQMHAVISHSSSCDLLWLICGAAESAVREAAKGRQY